MNSKFASAVLLFVCAGAGCWFGVQVATSAQVKPVIFTTAPKPVNAQLKLANGPVFVVHGRASLTVTEANDNDSLAGTLTYALPDDARQKIAAQSDKTLKDVPRSVAVKDVTASFRRGTACPLIRIEIAIKEADVIGAKLSFDRVALDIQETPDQMNQLFCSWTRQINAKRQRRGVIAAINRLINVEDDNQR